MQCMLSSLSCGKYFIHRKPLAKTVRVPCRDRLLHRWRHRYFRHFERYANLCECFGRLCVCLCTLGTSSYVLVCLVTSWYIPLRRGTSCYVLVSLVAPLFLSVHLGTSWYVLVRLRTSWYILVCHSTSCWLLVRPGRSCYVLVGLGTSWCRSWYFIIVLGESCCVLERHDMSWSWYFLFLLNSQPYFLFNLSIYLHMFPPLSFRLVSYFRKADGTFTYEW